MHALRRRILLRLHWSARRFCCSGCIQMREGEKNQREKESERQRQRQRETEKGRERARERERESERGRKGETETMSHFDLYMQVARSLQACLL